MTKTLRIGRVLPPLLRPGHAARTGSPTAGAGCVALRCLLTAIDANSAPDQANFAFVTVAADFSTASVSGPDEVFERGRCIRRWRREGHQLQ
jgi:hypothetical protein